MQSPLTKISTSCWLFALTLVCVCAYCWKGYAQTSNTATASARKVMTEKAIQDLKTAAEAGPSEEECRMIRADEGHLTFFWAPPGNYVDIRVAASSSAEPGGRARAMLMNYKEAFGIYSGNTSFIDGKIETEDQREIVHQKQLYRGIPVFGAETVIQLDARFGCEAILCDIMTNTAALDDEADSTVPAINTNAASSFAREIVLARIANDYVELLQSQDMAAIRSMVSDMDPPRLVIYDPCVVGRPGNPSLAWESDVILQNPYPIAYKVLLDAQRGSDLFTYSLASNVKYRRVCDCAGTLLCQTTRYEGNLPIGQIDTNTAYDIMGSIYDYFNRSIFDSRDIRTTTEPPSK